MSILFIRSKRTIVAVKPIKKINWVPDFQEVHFPQYFTSEIIARRKKNQVKTVCKGDIVVFSSADAQKDFSSFIRRQVKQFVMRFAVTNSDLDL